MSATYQGFDPLNESPSEKEGKLKDLTSCSEPDILALNESPSEKEGKLVHARVPDLSPKALNESPSEKEGK